jgi:protein O-GlcNAc transferase
MKVNKAIQSAFGYYQKGDFKEAESRYKNILKKQPQQVDALHFLGIIYYQLGNYDLAIDYIKRELQANPKDADAYNNLGLALQGKRKLDEAVDCFQKALQLDPALSNTYYNLGNVLKEKGEPDEAVACFQKALKLDPNFAYAYNNLGVIFKEKGLLDKAVPCFQKAIQLNPNLTSTYYNLGLGLQKKGRLDEAISCFQKALQLNPNYADACNSLGVSLQEKGQFDEAITCYQKALQLNPNLADAYNNLGISYYHRGQLSEAITSYQKALQLAPELYDAYNNMGCALKDMGQIDKAEDWLKRAFEVTPDFSSAYSNLLFTMQYNARHEARTIYLEHLHFSKEHEGPLSFALLPHSNERDPSRKLRIGYLSPDFRKHAVSSFIEPVLISHNREDFEVFCYANSRKHDEVTNRMIKHADHWHVIAGMSDMEVAERIRKDKIDLLVDLAGHTSENRILVFALKPAPVQINWIGYLATTGLSAMDYKIVDNYTDPQGETEQFYTEKLLRLPGSFLCYLPEKDSPEVGPLPALSAGHITFGTLNNFCKITPEVFTLWAKILEKVPASRLIMKGKSFHDPATCQYAVTMFTQRGITAERISLQSWDTPPKHLDSYNQIDIGLDTFPFNGGATTCEALWMGVPVITRAGTAYAARMGASFLSNVGLPELIAKTDDEYMEIAVNLASNREQLQALRKSLRDRMSHSPLTDANRFTRNLESCYRSIWEDWRSSSQRGS